MQSSLSLARDRTRDHMRHVVVSEAADLQALEKPWSALLVRSGHVLLPLTHLWTTIWWRAFGAARQPRIHCFYAGERLLAVVPMLVEPARYRGVAIRQMVSMANGHSPFSEPVLDRDLTDAQLLKIVATIAASAGSELTRFERLPADSRLGRAFSARGRLGKRPVGLKPGMSTPLIRIDSDWETFFGKRSQKFRKSMRNKVNRFNKTEGYSIDTDPAVVAGGSPHRGDGEDFEEQLEGQGRYGPWHRPGEPRISSGPRRATGTGWRHPGLDCAGGRRAHRL